MPRAQISIPTGQKPAAHSTGNGDSAGHTPTHAHPHAHPLARTLARTHTLDVSPSGKSTREWSMLREVSDDSISTHRTLSSVKRAPAPHCMPLAFGAVLMLYGARPQHVVCRLVCAAGRARTCTRMPTAACRYSQQSGLCCHSGRAGGRAEEGYWSTHGWRAGGLAEGSGAVLD